ncbi:TlpA family protein disulfide reductase [Solitalea koreensis]|uniref:Thiol-disulfide isomerase or thioredoxin n=1 Tax=Solitalea koreensis TaxID=543615 RepID=A0A521DYW3_9SPHI|nr:TlpA disulfide reductase family protein [Solitalea koreensis]SMO76876.1 Thiol-disulfide isomerase or thioredoxin [Solitalea koreensis]
MKNFIKSLALVLLCIAMVVSATAQSRLVTITGSVTEKKYYEIMIGGKSGDKTFRVVQHNIDPGNTNFSLVFPAKMDASYKLEVRVMKMGNRRLEPETYATLPLDLTGKQSINLTINPAQFNQNTGFKIEKLPAKFATATISGSFNTARFSMDLTLEKVVEGHLQQVQTCFGVKGDSVFNFLTPIDKEGIYYFTTLAGKKSVYLKPNDKLQLVLDRTGKLISAAKSTEENNVLQKWDELISPLTEMLKKPNKQFNQEDFTAVYQSLQPQIKAFVQQVKTKNPKFNELFKTAAQLDNNMAALNMLLKTNSVNRGSFSASYKEFVNVPDYYKQTLKANAINSANLLKLGEGYDYINLNAKLSLDDTKTLTDAEKVKILMNSTANDTLKSYLLKSQLNELELNVSNYTEFRDVFLPYKKYAKVPSVKVKYDGVSGMYAADTAFLGKSAYDFTLPDVNGKMVSMKEFKGKVVLVDVWATWCGPCKAQMPFLKEVEELYKGNDNIAFVGISLDAAKDKQKWMNMILEKQLEGVQLLDDFGRTFGRKYKIAAIPRFLLIDKNGNWAEVRCPLPENKEKLKKYIDRELQKGS